MKKTILLIFLSFIFTLTLFSDQTDDNNENIVKFRGTLTMPFVYYFPDNPLTVKNHIGNIDYMYDYDFTDDGDEDYEYHDKNNPGREIKAVPYQIESMITGTFSIIYPVARGKSFLLKNNYLKQKIIFGVSPINFEGGMSVEFSPLPFLLLEGGTTFGTGWNINGLNLKGMARNNYSGNDPDIAENIIMGDNFFGPIMKNWLKITLQMDVSPVLPEKYKRWTHILMSAEATINNHLLLNYGYLDRPYYYRTSLKMNGWDFSSSFALGYMIPVIIDERKKEAEKKQWMGPVKHNNFSIITLFLTELGVDLSHFNYSRMSDGGWGSDFVSCKFGPALVFSLPYNLTFFTGVQWKNSAKYYEDTIGNADFMKRQYEDWYVSFYRIILNLSYSF